MTDATLPNPTNTYQWTLKVLSVLGRHAPRLRHPTRTTEGSEHADSVTSPPLVPRFEDYERDVLLAKQSAEALQWFLTRGIDR